MGFSKYRWDCPGLTQHSGWEATDHERNHHKEELMTDGREKVGGDERETGLGDTGEKTSSSELLIVYS